MRGLLRWWLVVAAVCGSGLIYLLVAGVSGTGNAIAHGGRSSTGRVHGAPRTPLPAAESGVSARMRHIWTVDARKGMIEMLGTADGSRVGWNRHFAEWGGLIGPHWWQSALAMLSAIRYAEQTNWTARCSNTSSG